jgi:hypothetical protein
MIGTGNASSAELAFGSLFLASEFHTRIRSSHGHDAGRVPPNICSLMTESFRRVTCATPVIRGSSCHNGSGLPRRRRRRQLILIVKCESAPNVDPALARSII